MKKIKISGSKSISNRILILEKLLGNKMNIKNLSNSDDTFYLQKALNSKNEKINVGLAGTSMRFLISYFAIQKEKEIILEGEKRLNERPVGELVNALKSLGADIEYLEKENYPPLKIKGKNINSKPLKINSNISSQFISSLLLISPFLDNGLEIELQGNKVSFSYIETTLNILKYFGVPYEIRANTIKIKRGINFIEEYNIESDWSSASYFYSKIALTNEKIELKNFYKNSFQADRNVVEIYKNNFGINTKFEGHSITLEKDSSFKNKTFIELDLIQNPDIAQTIAVTCLAQKIKCKLKGLRTLRVKETDRLQAMKNEIEKLGAEVNITDDTLEIIDFNKKENKKEKIKIKTYNDHRMAMSFAPLLFAGYNISFDDKNVVKKSYPEFWKDFFDSNNYKHLNLKKLLL